MGRRALNSAVDQIRRQRHVDALVGLEARCADPACNHELGYHRFVTFTLPTPCGMPGCSCGDFKEEPPMLNPHDPFAGMPEPLTDSPFGDLGEPEPPDHDETPTLEDHVVGIRRRLDAAFGEAAGHDHVAFDALSAPVGAQLADEASTPVRFPVLIAGASSMPVADILGPAQRVAEIVEALEPVLVPPLAVLQLQELVATANALEVTDADSYKRCTDLYELLAANEKGIEEGDLGNVVRFFHRPWKAFCDLRAKYAKPVTEAKKRLSDIGGAWKLEQDKRDALAARQLADAAAADERARLKEIAEAATSAAAAAPAGSPVREVLEQTAVQATEQSKHVHAVPAATTSSVPQTGTKGRKKYEAVVVDEDAFYKALFEDRTRRRAAPLDLAYLNKQATELTDEFPQRFPGLELREKGGLTAGGRR